jgi:hypothetical protein
MPTKRSPAEIIADFVAAWTLACDPTLVEVAYSKGWYRIGRSETGKRPEYRRRYLPYVPGNWFEEPTAVRGDDVERYTRRLHQMYGKEN